MCLCLFTKFGLNFLASVALDILGMNIIFFSFYFIQLIHVIYKEQFLPQIPNFSYAYDKDIAEFCLVKIHL